MADITVYAQAMVNSEAIHHLSYQTSEWKGVRKAATRARCALKPMA